MKKLNTIGSMAILGALLIAMNFGGITGCGSTEDAAGGGGGTTTGTGTGDPTADAVTTTNDTLTVAGEAMSSALSGGAGLTALTIDRVKNVAETVDESVACSGGGTASVSGTIDTTETSGTIDVEMAFDDCDGINGDLNLDATLTLSETESETEFDFEMSFDGELGGNGCEVAFDELTMILNIVIDGQDVSSSGSVDGSVSATCGDDSVTCTFDSVSIDAGEDAFAESCTCTGDGCTDDSSSSDTDEDDSSDDDSSCVDDCMASDICDADVTPDSTDCDECIEDCSA